MTGPAASDDNSAQTAPGALVREVAIVNKKGLHAAPRRSLSRSLSNTMPTSR